MGRIGKGGVGVRVAFILKEIKTVDQRGGQVQKVFTGSTLISA
jgi:hypothetical protein